MKLTREKLKSLVKQVLKESKMNLVEELDSDSSFEGIYAKMADPEGPAQWAFITAHNPPGKSKHGKGFGWNNQKEQNKLISDLNSLGYKFVSGHGVYGGQPEESLLVFSNSDKNDFKFKMDMIKLGKKYLQDAIVYAEKYKGAGIDYEKGEYPVNIDTDQPLPAAAGIQQPSGSRDFWNMQMMMLMPDGSMKPTPMEKHRIDKQSNFLLTGNTIQARKDFYTIMKGLKSYVPFYDKDREEMIPNPFPKEE
jgi:hypothetical protein